MTLTEVTNAMVAVERMNEASDLLRSAVERLRLAGLINTADNLDKTRRNICGAARRIETELEAQ